MGISDFLKLADKTLKEAFHHTPVDPAKARKPFLKLIEKAEAQFTSGKQPRGADKWWSANNNVVHFTPSYNGTPVLVGDEAEHYIPAERFPDALKALSASVNAGEFDAQLTGGGSSAPKAASSTSGKKRAGWSDERRAKQAASIAARKAK